MANTEAIARINPSVIDLQARVGRVEDQMREVRQANSEAVMELALMRKDVTTIKEGQDKITGGINKILWAIALSVITAGTTFVLSGGLVIVQQ